VEEKIFYDALRRLGKEILGGQSDDQSIGGKKKERRESYYSTI
jgi:hypothetical protein